MKGEGNQQDYGMRVYDPRIGKFLSVDPITAKYPMLTPYQFASNSPITNIDIDGLEGKGFWDLFKSYLGVGIVQPKTSEQIENEVQNRRGMEIIKESIEKTVEAEDKVFDVVPGYTAISQSARGNYGHAAFAGILDVFGAEAFRGIGSIAKKALFGAGKGFVKEATGTVAKEVLNNSYLNVSLFSHSLSRESISGPITNRITSKLLRWAEVKEGDYAASALATTEFSNKIGKRAIDELKGLGYTKKYFLEFKQTYENAIEKLSARPDNKNIQVQEARLESVKKVLNLWDKK